MSVGPPPTKPANKRAMPAWRGFLGRPAGTVAAVRAWLVRLLLGAAALLLRCAAMLVVRSESKTLYRSDRVSS
jgi:hypothetical protein